MNAPRSPSTVLCNSVSLSLLNCLQEQSRCVRALRPCLASPHSGAAHHSPPLPLLGTSKMKLHTYPNDPNAYKALIAAEIVGVKIDVPSTFQFGVTNRTPEFLKLNPFGKVRLTPVGVALARARRLWPLFAYADGQLPARSPLRAVRWLMICLSAVGPHAGDAPGRHLREQRHRQIRCPSGGQGPVRHHPL